jgi:hypothetical protein
MRRPAVSDKSTTARVIEGSAGMLGLRGIEIGLRLVDQVLLQDHALCDRCDRRFFGRDRSLALRNSRLVIAPVNCEERFACSDRLSGHNSDAGNDATALDGKRHHLARRLDDARASDVTVVRVRRCLDWGRRHLPWAIF